MSEQCLSKRQRQILDSIKNHQRDFGFAPTMRELRKITGLASTSSIYEQLKTLEKQGYIKRYPTCPRAISLLK